MVLSTGMPWLVSQTMFVVEIVENAGENVYSEVLPGDSRTLFYLHQLLSLCDVVNWSCIDDARSRDHGVLFYPRADVYATDGWFSESGFRIMRGAAKYIAG
jgi:hypothetical protein